MSFHLLGMPMEKIGEVCKRNRVQRLEVFGSAVTGGFVDSSDIDLLITFKPEARVGFITLARLRREFENLLGRKVDLVPEGGLKPAIRASVLASARTLYPPQIL